MFLSSAPTMVGDFVQTGADGRRSEGKIYVQKPGKLRFEYAAPAAALEVISDGTSVAVNDRKLKTQQTYAIGQTPLKFLLQDKIDLKSDTQILNVLNSPEAMMILLDDRTTFGGTSRIRLIFDPVTYELRQWQVRDPQGYETLGDALQPRSQAEARSRKLFKILAAQQRDQHFEELDGRSATAPRGRDADAALHDENVILPAPPSAMPCGWRRVDDPYLLTTRAICPRPPGFPPCRPVEPYADPPSQHRVAPEGRLAQAGRPFPFPGSRP